VEVHSPRILSYTDSVLWWAVFIAGSGIGGVEVFEKNCKEFEEKVRHSHGRFSFKVVVIMGSWLNMSVMHLQGGGLSGLKVVSPFLIPALIA